MMTETVVHVTTIKQWKSVLDVWFKNGYSWYSGDQKHRKSYFKEGVRELLLDEDNYILILTTGEREPISYKEFMAQQKEDNKIETYYVTREQLDLIEDIKNAGPFVSSEIAFRAERFNELVKYFDESKDKALLRYLGGDETIEFKVKEKLYRLVGVNKLGQVVYFDKTSILLPATISKEQAFTAPLEEIEKWQTPDWNIEKAD